MPEADRGPLRVIDFGRVSALKSQTLWHAIGYGVSAGAPPTLSFMRPADPYVSIGFHRRLDEVDLEACARRGLPVYRRMVGGGPVYLDDGQLFFQIAVPAASVPPARGRALAGLLAPAVAAFRAVGVDAVLDDDHEIVVGDRKICGHGAGQIGDAVVVVGNLIERFDHEAAAAIVRVPDEADRDRLVAAMRRYVAPTPVDCAAFRAAATSAYAAQQQRSPFPGELNAIELARLGELDARFDDPEWLRGPARHTPAAWHVKVRAGVWLFDAGDDAARVRARVVGGRLEDVAVAGAALNGSAPSITRRLEGCALTDARRVLGEFGSAGDGLAGALAHMEGVRG